MAAKWIEFVIGPLDQKKQYRQAKARLAALPQPYRTAAEAVNRYLMYYGGVAQGDIIMQMFLDMTDLWERAAVDGTPLREIVGADPATFVEDFVAAYGGRHWLDKERARLVEAIAQAEGGFR